MVASHENKWVQPTYGSYFPHGYVPSVAQQDGHPSKNIRDELSQVLPFMVSCTQWTRYPFLVDDYNGQARLSPLSGSQPVLLAKPWLRPRFLRWLEERWNYTGWLTNRSARLSQQISQAVKGSLSYIIGSIQATHLLSHICRKTVCTTPKNYTDMSRGLSCTAIWLMISQPDSCFHIVRTIHLLSSWTAIPHVL